jgi:REP element-mobilizing transposase RayT
MRRHVGNLRTKKRVRVIRQAIARAVAGGFRIVDWSIQGDHMHLIVEAAGTAALSRSMQGLCIRIARGLNRELGRRGKVFADRYHAHVLKTPTEVRNARAYVMLNARRHTLQRGQPMLQRRVDPYSSWAWFDGWKDCPPAWVRAARSGPDAERCNAEPKSWLMRIGWRRHRLIRIDEVPGKGSATLRGGTT